MRAKVVPLRSDRHTTSVCKVGNSTARSIQPHSQQSVPLDIITIVAGPKNRWSTLLPRPRSSAQHQYGECLLLSADGSRPRLGRPYKESVAWSFMQPCVSAIST